jgi:hypothetical protein
VTLLALLGITLIALGVRAYLSHRNWLEEHEHDHFEELPVDINCDENCDGNHDAKG